MMRKLVMFSCLLTVGSMLWAQPDEAKYRELMKQIGPATGPLGKKIAAKDASAAEDAQKLQTWFDDVHKFWVDRKADDAITFAKTAGDEFGNVSKLAGAGNWEEAQASFKKATANCAGCHKTHREKAADGGWTIK